MANINDVIKYAVRSEADRIQRIKAAALKMQTMETYVCTSPDEKTARPGRPTKAEYEAGWRLRKVPYEKVIQHISPRHPDWERYQAARRQVSFFANEYSSTICPRIKWRWMICSRTSGVQE